MLWWKQPHFGSGVNVRPPHGLRAIEEPTTLQIPMTVAFLLCQPMAAKVSAVSPDCEIAIKTSLSLIIGSLYLNSEAYSTSTEFYQCFKQVLSY